MHFLTPSSLLRDELEPRINVEVIDDLKQKLNEKDSQLTEIRYENNLITL